MSVVNVRPSLSASDSVEYALYGVGKTKLANLRAGTTRAVALTCSVGDPAAFVTLAHDIARAKSRKIEAYSYVQSFASTEFDINNPDDIKRVHDLGVALAQKMHTADFVVVTHTDSAGGNLHNHIYVANHDKVTGKSLTRFRSWTRGLHQLNDSLMREEGCEVLPSPERAKDDWDTRRATFASGGFEQTLGDKIMEVLSNDQVRDRASFERALEAEGVRLAETARDGWSYKMRRDTGKWGRKKASSLCDEFTAKNVGEIFNYRNKQIQESEEKMKLLDKMKQVEQEPQEEMLEVDLQETAPAQVEEIEEDAQEKYIVLSEFTEEQKQEIWRRYDQEESKMRNIERENDKPIGSMDYLVRTVFEVDLERLADEWDVHEIDKEAALAAVQEVKEKNAKNAMHTNREKSAKPAARTASEAKPQRSEQHTQPKQYKQQPAQATQKQQQPKEKEELSPEEQIYEAARDGVLNVIRRGESSLSVMLAAWVMLVKAEHKLIKAKEKPTPEEMREIEERDAADEARLKSLDRAEVLEELEYRARRDLLKQYKRGIKQLKRQQKQAQQQQPDDEPALTPEQQKVVDDYHTRQAIQRQQSELEL